MTFDLDLWSTDLTINRDHLLTKDYLPTKFEASGVKRYWVISCTKWSKLAWPLTLAFDLLTWKWIGIICSPRTIYLPSLKLLGQSVIELSVAQGKGLPTYRPTDQPTDIPTDRCKAICPPFSKHNKDCKVLRYSSQEQFGPLWILGIIDRRYLRNECLFSGFRGNNRRSEQTNHLNREAVLRQICMFRNSNHFPMSPGKTFFQYQDTLFVTKL